jgi:hypothetical protein
MARGGVVKPFAVASMRSVQTRWRTIHAGFEGKWLGSGVADHIRAKRLRWLLPDWNTVDADFYALYTQEAAQISRVRTLIDFLKQRFLNPPWRG